MKRAAQHDKSSILRKRDSAELCARPTEHTARGAAPGDPSPGPWHQEGELGMETGKPGPAAGDSSATRRGQGQHRQGQRLQRVRCRCRCSSSGASAARPSHSSHTGATAKPTVSCAVRSQNPRPATQRNSPELPKLKCPVCTWPGNLTGPGCKPPGEVQAKESKDLRKWHLCSGTVPPSLVRCRVCTLSSRGQCASTAVPWVPAVRFGGCAGRQRPGRGNPQG